MLTEQQVDKLNERFPAEALGKDTSRGFELTSIKAMYIFERLNQVFGTCGVGWRYAHTPIIEVGGEYVTEVALQVYIGEKGISGGINWVENVGWVEDGHIVWGAPIYAHGGKRPATKGMSPVTDANKSAVTDGLTKAASLMGIGHDVFKGHPEGSSNSSRPKQSAPAKSLPEQTSPTATDFFKAVKEKGGASDKSRELSGQASSGKITWAEAIKQL